jgi:hypothetical protein
MGTLTETIAALFERAATEPAAEATVARGLHLKARYMDGMRQLLLARPDVQPSDLEVTTCAKHGGFTEYHVSIGSFWQCITETKGPAYDALIVKALTGTLGSPADAKIGLTPALTGQVCGTCANGLPTEYPNEVECQLGWEAHDKQPKGYNQKTKKADVPVHLGHGSLALPVATPDHRCLVDAWRYRA